MKFYPTFEEEDGLWCASYDEHDGRDILEYLFDLWNDVEYLTEFFEENIADLEDPYWQGISIDDAITFVQEERQFLEDKLICIYFKEQECDNVQFNDIFFKLNNHEYSLNRAGKRFWKVKLNSIPQILRLYAVELDDCHIIASGAIKITKGMNRDHFNTVFSKLQQVQDYLKGELISSKKGLKE